jgi:hypothetical protein
MKKTEINCQTGEVLERDFTPEELSKIEQRKAERDAQKQAEEEKQAKLESAKAKLTALGLDEAEVQAILGL